MNTIARIGDDLSGAKRYYVAAFQILCPSGESTWYSEEVGDIGSSVLAPGMYEVLIKQVDQSSEEIDRRRMSGSFPVELDLVSNLFFLSQQDMDLEDKWVKNKAASIYLGGRFVASSYHKKKSDCEEAVRKLEEGCLEVLLSPHREHDAGSRYGQWGDINTSLFWTECHVKAESELELLEACEARGISDPARVAPEDLGPLVDWNIMEEVSLMSSRGRTTPRDFNRYLGELATHGVVARCDSMSTHPDDAFGDHGFEHDNLEDIFRAWAGMGHAARDPLQVEKGLARLKKARVLWRERMFGRALSPSLLRRFLLSASNYSAALVGPLSQVEIRKPMFPQTWHPFRFVLPSREAQEGS